MLAFAVSPRRCLEACVRSSGDSPAAWFSASRGPWYGFNGTETFALTARSLWRARWTIAALFTSRAQCDRWDLGECDLAATEHRTRVRLRCPDGDCVLRFASEGQARDAVTQFHAAVTRHT